MGITRVNDEIRVECHTRNMGREIKMRNKHKIWWKIHFSVSLNQIQIHQKHTHTHTDTDIYTCAPTVIRLICSSHSLFLVDDYSGFGCCCTHHWLEAYASVRVLYRMNFNFSMLLCFAFDAAVNIRSRLSRSFDYFCLKCCRICLFFCSTFKFQNITDTILTHKIVQLQK